MGGERAAIAEGERAHFLAMDGGEAQGGEGPAAQGSVVPVQCGEFPHSGRNGLATAVQRGLGWLRSFWMRIESEAMRDQARGAGFLCLPILMGIGVVWYFTFPFEPGGLPVACAVAALFLAVGLVRKRPLLLALAGALLAVGLGFAAAKVETWRTASPVLGSEVTTRISGRVVRIEEQATGRIRLIIDISATERPRLRFPPQRVRLTARMVPDGLRPGDPVRGLVRLMPPSGPVRPGSYDFSFASYFNGMDAIGFFMSGPETVEPGDDLPLRLRPARWLETVRLALAERIRSHLHGAEGEVAVAIISGYRPGIPEEVNEWLRRAGLAHILAISGLHMALVALTVMTMLRAGCALFPGFAAHVPIKKYAAAAALAFCTLYLFISGAAVAAQRSYIMLGVMLAALIFDRAALTMRNVAIAALVIIAWSPHEVVGPSFQLSFAATAALVAGYAAWNDWRRGRVSHALPTGSFPRRLLRAGWGFLIGLTATSLIAGTATALYGVWHFQRATPLALPANLLAMPLVSLIAMPSAVLAMLAMPFGLDGFFLKIMGDAISATIAIARWFSERTPLDAVGIFPLEALLALTAALAILVVSTTWLRILAFPLILLGVGSLLTRELPDVLVSEDARLVAVRGANGGVAVNRARPNGFTIDDWRRALVAENVVKPMRGDAASLVKAGELSSPAFHCEGGLCVARHGSGAVVAHAENAGAAQAACTMAVLLVVDDATAPGELCAGKIPMVVTKRDLARRGSATVRFHRAGAELHPEIVFAIDEHWRPWHTHRAWSRAARGLPPREDGPRRGKDRIAIANNPAPEADE